MLEVLYDKYPQPIILDSVKKSWSGLGPVTVKPSLNNFCNYVKGVTLRGKHSGYGMPLLINSHLSLPTVPPFVARDTLCAWQEKNHPWLELSDVHRETTENIRVTVIPFYMGMRVGLCCVSVYKFCFLFNWHVFSKTTLLTEGIFCLLEKLLFNHSLIVIMFSRHMNVKLFCHTFLENSSCNLAFACYLYDGKQPCTVLQKR